MKLTANHKRALRRLWKGDLTTEEICTEVGLTAEQLVFAAQSMGLPPREEPEFYLPDEATIRLECAKIRASWTPEEREARLGRIKKATGADNNGSG